MPDPQSFQSFINYLEQQNNHCQQSPARCYKGILFANWQDSSYLEKWLQLAICNMFQLVERAAVL